MLLSACVKQSDFKDTDKKYVFTFEDIVDFKIEEYTVKPMKNGKEYFYTKSNTELNGSSSMYNVILKDELGREVSLRTSVNLQSNAARATELFESSAKTVKALYKSSIKAVKPNAYKADELLIVESEDYFSLQMRNNNLYYNIEIDGMPINEEQIKDKILKKVDYILNKGIENWLEHYGIGFTISKYNIKTS